MISNILLKISTKSLLHRVPLCYLCYVLLAFFFGSESSLFLLQSICNIIPKAINVCNPAGIYLLKVNNRNTRTRCEICSKLTIKTPERRH